MLCILLVCVPNVLEMFVNVDDDHTVEENLWITSRELRYWDEGLFLISSQSSHYDFVCMQENYAKTIFYIWPKGVWGVPGPFFVTASPCKHDHRENYISVEFFWPDFHHSQLLMRFDSILHAKQFASITINEIQQKRCSFHSGSNFASVGSYVYFYKEMGRWRLWILFSISSIFTDFLATKSFKIPISLSTLMLIFPNVARFARTYLVIIKVFYSLSIQAKLVSYLQKVLMFTGRSTASAIC